MTNWCGEWQHCLLWTMQYLKANPSLITCLKWLHTLKNRSQINFHVPNHVYNMIYLYNGKIKRSNKQLFSNKKINNPHYRYYPSPYNNKNKEINRNTSTFCIVPYCWQKAIPPPGHSSMMLHDPHTNTPGKTKDIYKTTENQKTTVIRSAKEYASAAWSFISQKKYINPESIASI